MQGGNEKKCLELEKEMEEKGIAPNNMTYNTLIQLYGKMRDAYKCNQVYLLLFYSFPSSFSSFSLTFILTLYSLDFLLFC